MPGGHDGMRPNEPPSADILSPGSIDEKRANPSEGGDADVIDTCTVILADDNLKIFRFPRMQEWLRQWAFRELVATGARPAYSSARPIPRFRRWRVEHRCERRAVYIQAQFPFFPG